MVVVVVRVAGAAPALRVVRVAALRRRRSARGRYALRAQRAHRLVRVGCRGCEYPDGVTFLEFADELLRTQKDLLAALDARRIARVATLPYFEEVKHMKIKVTLVDVNGSLVAEVRAPAESSFGAASPTPKVIVWRERAFIRLPFAEKDAAAPRVYREAETYKAAHRPVR
jgi:hypothetical protein